MLNLKNFLADESGAVSVEYGFAILFAAVIATTILTTMRNEVSEGFTGMSAKLDSQINNIPSR